MPTYEHICTDDECKHEWEDMYSITASPPEYCPKCNKRTVKKLCSAGSKPIVTLTGHEYHASIKADAKRIEKESRTNENLRANIVGEQKWSQITK